MKIKFSLQIKCICIITILCFFPLSSYPENNSGARLWEVKGIANDGKNVKFYILGVSHDGLDSEYDDYFLKKVLPVFSLSSSLSFENALIIPENIPECSTPFEPTTANQEMMLAAREQVRKALQISLHFPPYPKNPQLTEEGQEVVNQVIENQYFQITKDMVDRYSELELILKWGELAISNKKKYETLRTNIVHEMQSKGEYKDGANVHPSVTAYLRKIRPNMKIESIESIEDIVDAYCSAKPHRENLFKYWFSSWRFDETKETLTDEIYSRIKDNDDFQQSIKTGRLLDSLLNIKEVESGIICRRNSIWLKKMLESSKNNQNKFYALGIAHLLPRSDQNNLCDDLITMLKNSGMEVNLL